MGERENSETCTDGPLCGVSAEIQDHHPQHSEDDADGLPGGDIAEGQACRGTEEQRLSGPHGHLGGLCAPGHSLSTREVGFVSPAALKRVMSRSHTSASGESAPEPGDQPAP